MTLGFICELFFGFIFMIGFVNFWWCFKYLRLFWYFFHGFLSYYLVLNEGKTTC